MIYPRLISISIGCVAYYGIYQDPQLLCGSYLTPTGHHMIFTMFGLPPGCLSLSLVQLRDTAERFQRCRTEL